MAEIWGGGLKMCRCVHVHVHMLMNDYLYLVFHLRRTFQKNYCSQSQDENESEELYQHRSASNQVISVPTEECSNINEPLHAQIDSSESSSQR